MHTLSPESESSHTLVDLTREAFAGIAVLHFQEIEFLYPTTPCVVRVRAVFIELGIAAHDMAPWGSAIEAI